MKAKLSQHLKTKIQIHLDFKSILFEELKIVGFIATSVIVIFLFAHKNLTFLQILLNGLIYGSCFGLGDLLSRTIPLFYSFQKNDQPLLSVGTIWFSSFVGFCTGFFIFSTVRFQVGLFLPDLFKPVGQVLYIEKFLLFLPIWFLVTYLMVIKDLSSKPSNLVKTESGADQNTSGSSTLSDQTLATSTDLEASAIPPFNLPRGSMIESLDPFCISHVSVNEHYTDIYFLQNDQMESIQVRMSLKEALKQLPMDSFFQIHRSHVVNLAHVADIDRKNGQLRLSSGEGNIILPVSRRKTADILSILRKRKNIIR